MAEDTLNRKVQYLNASLAHYGRLVIAYSGGVDSSLLLKMAYDILGDNVYAVTVDSALLHQHDREAVQEYVRILGVYHQFVSVPIHEYSDVCANTADRCYHCKLRIFSRIKEFAKDHSATNIADGSNADDIKTFRPGMKALGELGIESPLLKSGLSKEDVRILARDKNIPAWDRPSQPCLATRIPYGTKITPKLIRQIRDAENVLYGLSFKEFRVRYHDRIARIEVPLGAFPSLMESGNADKIIKEFKKLGFQYITLDMEGLRSGSMDETHSPGPGDADKNK